VAGRPRRKEGEWGETIETIGAEMVQDSKAKWFKTQKRNGLRKRRMEETQKKGQEGKKEGKKRKDEKKRGEKEEENKRKRGGGKKKDKKRKREGDGFRVVEERGY